MIKYEWNPICGGFAAATPVNATAENFGNDGEDDGTGHEAEDGAAPAVVIVEDELDAGGHVARHVQNKQSHKKGSKQRMS